VLGDRSASVVRIRAGSAVRIRQWEKIMAARPITTAVAEEGHTRRRLHVTSPVIVTHCAEQVFCFGGGGLTGATRPSTAWRFLRAAAFTGATATAPPDRILAAITLDIDDITTA